MCLVDYESGPDDVDLSHTALSTSGYAVGKRLLDMGLGGINREKIDESNKNRAISDVSDINIPSAEDIVAQKKRKKVCNYPHNFGTRIHTML